MYRIVQKCEVRYGAFAQYAAAMEELNTIARSRGWKEARCLVPIDGQSNRIVMELEYDSLDEYQREENAFYADPEAMKVLRSTVDLVVQGSAVTEILAPVPDLA
jgi:hypothetical protein